MAEIDQLAAALSTFQKEVVTVEKTAANPFFNSKYATLEAIMLTALPVLTKHGLAVSQFITHIDGSSALRTILMHKSGQFIEDVMPLLLSKVDPQGQGSAITYARRYSYAAVLGIVIDEDDDGNRASSSHASSQPAKTSAPKKSGFNANSSTGEKLISDAQGKLLLARARDAYGLSDWTVIKQEFSKEFGVEVSQVTRDKVDEILNKLTAKIEASSDRSPDSN